MQDSTKTYADLQKKAQCIRTEPGHRIHTDGQIAWPYDVVRRVLDGEPEFYLPTKSIREVMADDAARQAKEQGREA